MKNKISFLVLLSALFLAGCGIPKIKGNLISSKPGAQVPDLIAILPPDNRSVDLSAVEVIQRAAGMALTSRGYYAIANKAQDAELQKMGITDGGQLRAYRAEQLCKALGVQGLIYSTVEEFKEVNIGFWVSKNVKMNLILVNDKGENLWVADGMFRVRTLTLSPEEALQAFAERKMGELVEKALRVHLVPESQQAAMALATKVSPWPNPQDAPR